MTPRTPVIAVDFDGVIHQFTTPWTASTIIPDPPVDGAFAWLRMLLSSGTRVWLHTARVTQFSHPWSAVTPDIEEPIEARVRALHEWFRTHGGGDIMEHQNIGLWQWPGKPHADWYVDDHAVRFVGVFPTQDELMALHTPWNKAAPHLAAKAEAERVALLESRRPVTLLEHDRLADRVKLLEESQRALVASLERVTAAAPPAPLPCLDPVTVAGDDRKHACSSMIDDATLWCDNCTISTARLYPPKRSRPVGASQLHHEANLAVEVMKSVGWKASYDVIDGEPTGVYLFRDGQTARLAFYRPGAVADEIPGAWSLTDKPLVLVRLIVRDAVAHAYAPNMDAARALVATWDAEAGVPTPPTKPE